MTDEVKIPDEQHAIVDETGVVAFYSDKAQAEQIQQARLKYHPLAVVVTYKRATP